MAVFPAQNVARRIRDLLALGLNYDKIAYRLGMKTAKVEKVARQLAAETPADADESPPGFDPSNLRRCPQCGAMVYLWPCLTCENAAREQNAAQVRAASRAIACRLQRTC